MHKTGVSDITALSSVEKEGISKLFAKVRKRYGEYGHSRFSIQ